MIRVAGIAIPGASCDAAADARTFGDIGEFPGCPDDFAEKVTGAISESEESSNALARAAY